MKINYEPLKYQLKRWGCEHTQCKNALNDIMDAVYHHRHIQMSAKETRFSPMWPKIKLRFLCQDCFEKLKK